MPTRTPNTFIPAVIVEASSGEFLQYRLTVRGAIPGIFTLVDTNTKQLIWSSKDAPISTSPDFVYERKWPLPIDHVQSMTSHTMGLSFVGITSYKYEVILHQKTGASLTIFDIDYVPTVPHDSFFEDLLVTSF